MKHAKTPEEQVTAWSNISESYGYLGKPDSCRYASEQVLRIATESNQDLLLCRAYLYLGNYFSNVGDYKQALEYEFKSLKLAEKLDSLFDIWIATRNWSQF
ncbi:MAG: tetratricopeptide repeat protein [Bacteroidetes bacterium]|nr:tetratricopeptide repeat protein [Bacteroidota bacterium]